MKGIASTLATIWRLASPYFHSEDRWAGRMLLAAVIATELSIVGHQRAAEPVEQPLLQRAAGPQLGRLRQRAAVLLHPRRRLYLARGLSALPQPVAPDPLAAMDDQSLSRKLARRRQPLPHAASGRRRRQPRPAHRRRHPDVRRAHADHRHRPAQRAGDARLVRHHPMDAVGRGAAAPVRQRMEYPGLSGVGRADLCVGRHLFHASDRLAAGRAQFQPAAVRSRLPLQSRSRARELRADRAAQGRARRDRPSGATLRPRGGELAADHDAHQEADVLHRRPIRRSRSCFPMSWSARPISPARCSSAG